ncbi:hypothetical protein SARC_02526 [Sphaeroforma arctica JP610]|uniref:Fibronectin type-III domain-containing protein n=1 Tax=Sphaeroforma arctica JP610 TaxID=667725 RepID=A0A0L0GAM1_9EUKA|nr:hypothetical protein SARC_02526 [Sphaeroforma arctica JP610]KNC85303.1 hypothetical protein SARC_02526 [Sphaeroforma arctica JP610]|eukprot:XP_014159205.1 hypothetical protein SARC_02526 [Sphaeroforma arctica JP610]
MVVGFWYVALISQPVPSYSFIEACMGRFLPFLFIAYMLYLYGGKTAIPPPTHMLERFALYWFPAWFFVHMNYLTFIFPDEDITGGEQVVTDDGGIAVVQPPVSWNPLAITLMVAACSIALFLLYKLFRAIWRSGRTLPYLTGYISALAVLILFAVAVSSQYFVHLHHYQLGMAIWPITAFSMGPAAFAQSIMAGLYIQGVARWGFGSTFTYTGYRPKTPDFVGNITISNETTDGALVEWPAANYTIAPVYSVVVNTIEMCRVTDTQCRISGLLPGLSYHVCVRNVVEGYEGSCEGNQRFNTTAAPDL